MFPNPIDALCCLIAEIPPIEVPAEHAVNVPIDAVVKPRNSATAELPLFIEAKSAGDYTNVNKRRKEEAAKAAQLRRGYGADVR